MIYTHHSLPIRTSIGSSRKPPFPFTSPRLPSYTTSFTNFSQPWPNGASTLAKGRLLDRAVTSATLVLATRILGWSLSIVLGSTTDDADDPLKTQSQEHVIQCKEPCGYRECKDPYSVDLGQLKIHKGFTFSVQKTSSDTDDLEARSMPHYDPSHNHSTAPVTAC